MEKKPASKRKVSEKPKIVKSKKKKDLTLVGEEKIDTQVENTEGPVSEIVVDDTIDRPYLTQEEFTPLEVEIDEEPILIWEAPSFEDFDPPKWLKAGVVGVFLMIEFYAAVTQSFSTFFVILALAFLVYVYSKVIPEIVQQEVCESYIKVDGQKFYYDEIEKFWIDYDQTIQEVTFVVKNKFLSRITSQLGSLNPNLLREILKDKIFEVPPEPKSLGDYLSRILHL